jgi:hypothetical protein
MIGQYVMTEHDIMGRVSVSDGIAYGSYDMDSHNAQRVIVNGMVKNEGNTWISTPQPYMISYRSMTPDPDECVNLLVPVCLSASHIAYGSIRMEPVFMALGEVAGLAAFIAVEEKAEVQEIDVQKIQNYLHPKLSVNFVDVPIKYWAEDAIYKIYNVGITKGCSQNPLMFCPNKDVTREQVAAFIVRALEGEPDTDYYGTGSPFSDVSTASFFSKYIKRLLELEITKGCGGDNYCPNNSTTRAEMAAFLIRAVEGEPPADYCDTGSPFSDVSPASFFCKYIKRLLELEITKGCGPGVYCPDHNVIRAEMAAFLARAFLEMD